MIKLTRSTRGGAYSNKIRFNKKGSVFFRVSQESKLDLHKNRRFDAELHEDKLVLRFDAENGAFNCCDTGSIRGDGLSGLMASGVGLKAGLYDCEMDVDAKTITIILGASS